MRLPDRFTATPKLHGELLVAATPDIGIEIATPAGFGIDMADVIGSEWPEYRVASSMEQVPMTLARMRGAEHELVSRCGRSRDEMTAAEIPWRVFHLLLCKLGSHTDVLHTPGETSA